jgi:hypothetical protein
MENILCAILAAGGVQALPVGATWPLHRAVLLLPDECSRRCIALPLQIAAQPDPSAGLAVDGLETAFSTLLAQGLVEQHGSGYTARWIITPDMIASRRALMRLRPEFAAVLAYVGQRLATWASTALKNIDTAAASWAPTVAGPMPTLRHPPLVALR